MKVVLIGKKTIACKIARILKDYIELVVLEKDPKWQESLEETSKKLGLKHTRKWERVNEIKNLDYIISVQSSRIFTKSDISLAKYGILNIHFGKLPEYRGCNPIYHAIINGEKKAYVSIHFIDEDIDTGDIVSERGVNIEGKTARGVFDVLTEEGAKLMKDILPNMKRGKLKGRKQKGKAHYYKKSDVDFKKEVKKFKRIALALSFPPFQNPLNDMLKKKGNVHEDK